MGFRRHKAVKLKNSELSQKIYETVSSAKKLDEKLKGFVRYHRAGCKRCK